MHVFLRTCVGTLSWRPSCLSCPPRPGSRRNFSLVRASSAQISTAGTPSKPSPPEKECVYVHGLSRIPTTLASGVASSNGATEDLESESKEERDRLVFALRALSKEGIESELCSSLPLLLVDGGEADDELDIEVSVPLLLTSSSLRSTFTLRRCKSLVLYALGVDTHRGSDTELDLW